MQLIDTHAHIDQPEFDGDRDEMLARAWDAGLIAILAVGSDRLSSARCAALAAKYERVFASVGIQPNYTADVQPGDWDEILKLAEAPHVVALGETGLDCYRDNSPLSVQQDYFDRHLRLSQSTGLPFIVHTRASDAEVVAMLHEARRRGPLAGVMHSFTGTIETARECIELGLYISFAGMVTFKNAPELREVARQIPADRILIETDSPYLAPHPKRGKRNEPALLVHTAELVAETRGESLEDFARTTVENSRRLFSRMSLEVS